MALSADDDVAQAVKQKWYAATTLVPMVPGGLQRGRLSSFQPDAAPAPHPEPDADTLLSKRVLPYARFQVSKSQPGIHNTGTIYVDIRLVTIEVYGLRAQVEEILSIIRDDQIFNRQTLATEAGFLACLQMDDPDVVEDETRRHGEGIWIGTVKLEVWTDRVKRA